MHVSFQALDAMAGNKRCLTERKEKSVQKEENFQSSKANSRCLQVANKRAGKQPFRSSWNSQGHSREARGTQGLLSLLPVQEQERTEVPKRGAAPAATAKGLWKRSAHAVGEGRGMKGTTVQRRSPDLLPEQPRAPFRLRSLNTRAEPTANSPSVPRKRPGHSTPHPARTRLSFSLQLMGNCQLKGGGVPLKGLYQKAEALYTMGDFEFALVFYHRGYRLRPDLQKFKLGIEKSQEAIVNCIGSPSSVKLENREDLCFISRQAESKKENQKLQIKLTKDQKWTRKEGPARNPKTERELLGELYADKAYLEKLLKDKDLMASSTKQGTKVADLVLSGISYLDTRGEFWQQQKPIYARVREHKLRQQRWIRDKKQKPAEVARYIVKSMEDIDMLLTGDCPEESCKKAERVLKTIQGWSDDEVPNKNQLIGNLHSCIGNAQLEMGQMEAALQSHKMDLEFARQNLKSSGTPKKIYKAEGSLDCIGNKTMSATMSSFSFQCSDLPDAVSRALDNIGRVYARMGKFQQAIDTWEEKIPMAKSSLEETWLFHEIGRCYLELNKAEQAQNYGEKSLQSAGEEGDVEWQLHATVLVAQAQVKLKDYRSAIMSFEKALEKAKLIHNEAAQKTIIIALDDASRSFIEELDKRREETTVYSLKDDGFGGENAKDNEEKEREQDAGKREAEKQSGGAGRFGGEPGSGRGGGQQGGSEGVAGGRGRRARRQQ
ncbi:outer dynein arm-docking complex subunit 4 isoform X3 [Phalacrocorax aristotelis]|uniref:outer dynein arm-docking complex subunit 4 isoform X3 n=1 Tax=Phalacrocorax aristotelis TaxID=126867 RepID=UPI003F4B69EF